MRRIITLKSLNDYFMQQIRDEINIKSKSCINEVRGWLINHYSGTCAIQWKRNERYSRSFSGFIPACQPANLR